MHCTCAVDRARRARPAAAARRRSRALADTHAGRARARGFQHHVSGNPSPDHIGHTTESVGV
ncbi:hypothetical protein VL15_29030 [Burkholderia cepacia]|uniref:Uncharacterized protein n=1 Tax=Burkholderia cepacia TaxID=292 RepID=A0A0J5WB96_BURCE|nr:hypothetical protein VL15_29030 [Burkholderia cepacia]